MKNISQHCLVLFFALFQITGTQAQNKETIPLSKMILEQWTGDDGLISNNLTSVFQSSDGFIWVTSFNGAHRFDGTRFLPFNKENMTGLLTNAIYSIVEDKNGILYFATQSSGLIRYDGVEFKPVPIPGLSSVRVALIDQKENIWIGTNNEGLFRINGETKERIDHPSLDQIIILDLAEDLDGNVWIATAGNGLIRYTNGEYTVFQQNRGIPDNYVSSLYVTKKGKLLAGTQHGLIEFDGEAFQLFVPDFPGIEINDMIEDDQNNLLLATEKGFGRINLRTKQYELIDEDQDFPGDQVSALTIDHEGSIWLSTKKAGLLRMNPGSITNLTIKDGLSYPRVNVAYEANGKYYIGCDDGSITIDSAGVMSVLNLQTKKAGLGVRDFAVDKDNALWVGSYLGLIRYKDGIETLFTKANGLSSEMIRRVLLASNGTLWLATRTGGVIQILDENHMRSYTVDNGLNSNYILDLEEAANGDILIGTHSGGFQIISGKEIKSYPIPDLPGVLIFNITIDGDQLWLSTNTGLFRFKNEQFTKVVFDDQFKLESFFDFIIDKDGNGWLTTNIGIVQLKMADLENLKNKVKVKIYNQSDGMNNKECTGATRSLLTSTGEVWVPTLGGVAIVNPKQLEHNDIIPEVVITSFVVDGAQRLANDIVIEPGHMRYTFQFASLSFLAPEKVQFKFRLNGFEEEYSSFTNSNREVEYTNLPPGEYSFSVLGTNNDGVWNEEPTEIGFIVRPYFYQTIWFYLLLFAVVSFAIRLIFLWKLRKVREVNDKLLKVNEELDRFVYSASHDLRAPLSSILGLTEVARREKDISAKDHCLGLIKGSVNKLDSFIKDILDYSRNQRMELVIEKVDIEQEIIQVCEDLKYLNKLETKIEIDSKGVIAQVDRRRLNVVLKNLIANALIYADSRKENPFIKIKVHFNRKILVLEVQDNGSGIASKHVPNIFKMFYRGREDSQGSGLGLYIVKESIDKLKGSIKVNSQEGFGTTFIIKLPQL